MKKILAILVVVGSLMGLAFSPAIVLGDEHQSPCGEGLEECKFTDKLVFEIIDNKTGQVVDRVVYERLLPISYNESMLMKYLRMLRNAEGGAKTYLDILGAGGNAKQALETQTQP